MLLSNLIDRLNDIYREHGDLNVDVETELQIESAAGVSTYLFSNGERGLVISGAGA